MLQELLQFIREELMSRKQPHEQRYDPVKPPYEAYNIDYDLFHALFTGISPWGKGGQPEELSARLFRVGVSNSRNISNSRGR